MAVERSLTARAWIELDRAALAHNVEALRALLPPGCTLMPAVKANAYGHGAALVAKELNRLGVDAFCVAAAAEGAALREDGIQGEILVLGYTHPSEFPLLERYTLTQTVVDASYARTLDTAGRKISVHLKIDTGMHRLGLPWDAPEELERLFRFPHLNITGAYTHLCSDCTTSPSDRAFTQEQSHRFHEAVTRLEQAGCVLPSVHILSSYGLLNYPELGGSYARIGIALYGLLSSREDTDRCAVPLKPVLSLKARVAHVQEIPAGEGVGYDLTFVPRRPSRVAALAIGYADGLPRSLSCGVGNILLHGRRAPIVGRICMDQTLVDVTDIPDAAPGDTAVLIGRSGGQELTACQVAEQAGTITNELLSRMGPRLDRFFV